MSNMDLINVYIQEVTRRLPEKMREDISLELRSTILDMLPDDFTKEDVEQVLEKFGNPAELAAGYRDRPMHLIGPKVYDQYVSVLKMVFFIVAIVTTIVLFIENMGAIFGSETSPIVAVTEFFGEAIWALTSAAIQVFFWVSLVFIILDRTINPKDDIPLSLAGKEWTPKDLSHIPFIPLKKKIMKSEVWFGLFWTVLWVTIYFNATHIVGIYQEGNNGLEFKQPIFNQEILMSYLVIVIIIALLELFRIGYKAMAQEWTFKLAISNTLIHLAGFIFLIIIASNPDLFHSEFAPYMADLLDKPLESVLIGVFRIKWGTVLIIIVSGFIDSYQGFRKARNKKSRKI